MSKHNILFYLMEMVYTLLNTDSECMCQVCPHFNEDCLNDGEYICLDGKFAEKWGHNE